jgi:hypothetical protein
LSRGDRWILFLVRGDGLIRGAARAIPGAAVIVATAATSGGGQDAGEGRLMGHLATLDWIVVWLCFTG